MSGRGLFDPPPPAKTPRQLLLDREAELLAEYRGAGGARRDEIDRALIEIRAQLRLTKAPAPPAPPQAEFVPRRQGIRDGRSAAAGDG